MKKFLEDPKWQGQFRHLLSTVGPMLGFLLVVASMPEVTLLGFLQAVVNNWIAISSFALGLIPFVLSWRAKEKDLYTQNKVEMKNGD